MSALDRAKGPALSPLLRMAALAGVDAVVKLHIRLGSNLDARDGSGMTPLMLAASKNKCSVCALLIEAGADPALRDLSGRDAFLIASAAGANDAAELLSPSTHAERVEKQVHLDAVEAPAWRTPVCIEEDWKPAGLEDWEAEEASIPPEGDQSIADGAAAIHKAISLHVPVDPDDSSDYDPIRPKVTAGPSSHQQSSKEQMLIELANDSSVWVRCSVAANPATPAYLLDELASDPSQEVRSHATSNPSTPSAALARLVNDVVPVVRANVKKNPSALTSIPRDARTIGSLHNSRGVGESQVRGVQAERPDSRRSVIPRGRALEPRTRDRDLVQPNEKLSHAQAGNRLKSNDEIDRLIVRLVDICRSGPDFLEQEDAERYVYFLRRLSAFEIPGYLRTWGKGRQSAIRIGKLPIRDLRHVIGHWVMSHFSRTSHPIMPHLALNTAEFIIYMMRGCREDRSDGLRVESVMDYTFEAHPQLDDEFQRAFRRNLNPNPTFRGVVPYNAKFIWLRKADGQSVPPDYLPPGSVFAFDVTECHLSDSLVDAARILIGDEQSKPTPDICRDFHLHGLIRPLMNSPTVIGQFLEQKGAGQFIKLPFRWITAAVVLDPNVKRATVFSLPCWTELLSGSSSLEKCPTALDHVSDGALTEVPSRRTRAVDNLAGYRPSLSTTFETGSEQSRN